MSDFSVVVTCHEPYRRWLPQAVASIEQQHPEPAERVVVLDECEPVDPLPASWRIVHGKWGHPPPARNRGIEVTTSPWLIFWDADNVMPPGYIAAVQQTIACTSRDVAIAYPDIHLHDENLRPKHLWAMLEWAYWQLRAENYVDTAAAWRREGLEAVSGWPTRTNCFEDYALALDLTALGWKATKVHGPAVVMRHHDGSRMQRRWHEEGAARNDVWPAASPS